MKIRIQKDKFIKEDTGTTKITPEVVGRWLTPRRPKSVGAKYF